MPAHICQQSDCQRGGVNGPNAKLKFKGPQLFRYATGLFYSVKTRKRYGDDVNRERCGGEFLFIARISTDSLNADAAENGG